MLTFLLRLAGKLFRGIGRALARLVRKIFRFIGIAIAFTGLMVVLDAIFNNDGRGPRGSGDET
jgi:hypothetical protein